jgi:hypothetical protein
MEFIKKNTAALVVGTLATIGLIGLAYKKHKKRSKQIVKTDNAALPIGPYNQA